ncbi:protein-tyrosine phosphatase [Gracilibacillus ureilyticus]|uniref:Tyrosine-protein phosphatase n=1 Tax=Gracilibacillus ureilyticus TaxID=531814 RepID=A0A1H9RCV7_9BACI|nr:CpsB/CapC family capsule biosynthesis tyrosine phosphatase [Gracilibacillus ureilyticus]SER69859.1 protein-tyrosine phosphatase [Gracilibacillus ureilyticus]
MIDLHCHILPGRDDGAKHITESIEMAKSAVSQGIDTIIATPHQLNSKYNNYKIEIIEAVQQLNEILKESDIPLTILPGQETRINGEMITDLINGQLLPLNETSGYLFVELPFNHVPRYTKQLLFDLQVQGVKPIIVHPERNNELIEHPNILVDLVREGALTQLTEASVTGHFGKKVKKFCMQCIEANLTHFIASDAHNVKTRGFVTKDAHRVLKKEFGTQVTSYFMDNAYAVVHNQLIIGGAPGEIKSKKFMGLF